MYWFPKTSNLESLFVIQFFGHPLLVSCQRSSLKRTSSPTRPEIDSSPPICRSQPQPHPPGLTEINLSHNELTKLPEWFSWLAVNGLGHGLVGMLVNHPWSRCTRRRAGTYILSHHPFKGKENLIWTKTSRESCEKAVNLQGSNLFLESPLFFRKVTFTKRFRTERSAKLKKKQRLHDRFYFTEFFFGKAISSSFKDTVPPWN